MTKVEVCSSSLRMLLAVLCVSAFACKHDPDRVAGYVAALDQLQSALCDCKTDPAACEDEVLFPECSQRILRDHEDELASWLSCATREVRARAACVRDSACEGDPLDRCGGLDVEDPCGEVPEGPQMSIEHEIDAQCDEGNGSDSDTDNGSDDGTTLPATPDSMSAPMGTPTEPFPQKLCPTTPETLALVGANCVSCACNMAPFEFVACNESCWRQLVCAAHCSTTDAGADQADCMEKSCSLDLAGAEAAAKLGPILHQSCMSLCPGL